MSQYIMLDEEWDFLHPTATSRVKTNSASTILLPTYLQLLRTYWWWVPLLLLSILAGSAIASHHNQKRPTEVKPTLLVENYDLLAQLV